jgi:hypothetical protein
MNNTGAYSIALCIIAVGALMYFGNTVANVAPQVINYGAQSGTDPGFFTTFHGGMADGGDVYATSTGSNSTLLAAVLTRGYKQIDMTLTTSAGTLTMPASSTLAGWLPFPGDSRTIFVRNATTSSAIALTVAAGTGLTFKNTASSTAVISGDTDGGNGAYMTFKREANKNFTVVISKVTD